MGSIVSVALIVISVFCTVFVLHQIPEKSGFPAADGWGKASITLSPLLGIWVFERDGLKMAETKKTVTSRKWMVTINNPQEHGFFHDKIIEIMSEVKGVKFWCMCDEIGDECETYHTHIFMFIPNKRSADWVNNRFPNFHRDVCQGTCKECRDYVGKFGEKFNKDDSGHYHYEDESGKVHDGINYGSTFKEFGECPDEHQGKNREVDKILTMVQEGCSDLEILLACPSAMKMIDKIERTRSILRDEKFSKEWRDLDVTYIFGGTGLGKTRSVMNEYGYENVYRVTDYKHPFDTYDGQDVLIFEEFRSGLRHGDMLNYLDGYPLLLPCRYFNRQACFTKVFIISNIPPQDQYSGVDDASRQAFFRRIGKVKEFVFDGLIEEYDSVQGYIDSKRYATDYDRLPL